MQLFFGVNMENHFTYQNCHLCPNACGVDRTKGERGKCKMTTEMVVARASLHLWEEQPISGTKGSGTIFFSGCPMRCIYCQNHDISQKGKGIPLTESELTECILRLEKAGAHNLNLVTATHFLPTIIPAILEAKRRGFSLPVVYNTSGFENVETIFGLKDIVDIYLTDLRYTNEKTARDLSFVPNYPEVAKNAISAMFEMVGKPQFSPEGLMTRGVIVRLLLLPGHLIEAKQALRYLYQTYGDDIYLSLMSQYTPFSGLPSPLDRPVTAHEYKSFVQQAQSLGITRAFVQESSAATKDFIPSFDDVGFLPHKKI